MCLFSHFASLKMLKANDFAIWTIFNINRQRYHFKKIPRNQKQKQKRFKIPTSGSPGLGCKLRQNPVLHSPLVRARSFILRLEFCEVPSCFTGKGNYNLFGNCPALDFFMVINLYKESQAGTAGTKLANQAAETTV